MPQFDVILKTQKLSSAASLRTDVAAVDNGSSITISSVHASAVTVPDGANVAVISANGFKADGDTAVFAIVGWYKDGGIGVVLDYVTMVGEADFTTATGEYAANAVAQVNLAGVNKIYAYCTTIPGTADTAVNVNAAWL